MKKNCIKSILITLLLAGSFTSWAQLLNTFAGKGVGGYSGDGGQSNNAEIFYPYSVTVDKAGNVYIADGLNYRIRKVTTSGIISTYAGNGVNGYTGDGGPAIAAEFANPCAITFDTKGNIYFSTFNNTVRKVNTSGIISTLAGNGSQGFSGDGGQATNAEFHIPYGLKLDTLGNVYIADESNNRIRIVSTSGIINTFAGNGFLPGGFSGDGGQATAAELYYPLDVAFDVAGNVYITDQKNQRIRMVNSNGIINTIAGNGFGGYAGDGGNAMNAEFYYPYGITLDASDNIYIADTYNYVIREINTSGIINTIAGNNIASYSGDAGQATLAELNQPMGIELDASGNLYFADYFNNRVRTIGSITTGNTTVSSFPFELNIYPSPTSGSFTLNGISKGQTIELYNYLGQKVLSTISYQPSVNINISTMPDGIYLIKIQNKDGSVFAAKKFVKTE